MRTLPRHISIGSRGYEVRLSRNRIHYRAFVSFNHGGSLDAALQRAIELRDRFDRIAGEVRQRRCPAPLIRGKSNTGLAGISETTKWIHNYCQPCFVITWSRAGKSWTRRIYYHARRSRQAALDQAIALRARMTGLNPEQLHQALAHAQPHL